MRLCVCAEGRSCLHYTLHTPYLYAWSPHGFLAYQYS